MESNAKKRNKKRKGFTLVELIAVIAILGILAMIIVPKVGGYKDSAQSAKDKTEARAVLSAVEAYNLSVTVDKQIKGEDAVNDISTIGSKEDNNEYKALKDTVSELSSDVVRTAKISDLNAIAKNGKASTDSKGDTGTGK